MKILYHLKVAVIAVAASTCAIWTTIGEAQAQTQAVQGSTENRAPPANTPAPVANKPGGKSKQPTYNGGVNTGREIQFNTPGCVGPIDFCNLYFGS